MTRFRLVPLLLGAAGLLVAGCGSSDDASSGSGSSGGDVPTVVVTSNILGDVVESFAGDQFDVVTVMPVGADPHNFQASAQQANEMREADALIVNGASFEEGMLDVIDAAVDDGVPTYEAISAVETLEFGEQSHAHEDEEHAHEDEGEEHAHEDEDEEHAHEDEEHDHEHADGSADPHFFTDPASMALAVDGIADFLIENVDGIDSAALEASADEYVGELEALDAEVEATLDVVADDGRVLITNHEVFGYFADRYGFEVVGTVIPSGSTADGASAGDLAELAELIEAEGVPAIFADTSSSDELAATLSDEVGDIEVVELYSESLGDEGSDGATYLTMVGSNAQRIASALG